MMGYKIKTFPRGSQPVVFLTTDGRYLQGWEDPSRVMILQLDNYGSVKKKKSIENLTPTLKKGHDIQSFEPLCGRSREHLHREPQLELREAEGKKPDPKGHTVRDSIHTNYPE